jgi:hypothetical protein
MEAKIRALETQEDNLLHEVQVGWHIVMHHFYEAPLSSEITLRHGCCG